LRDKRLAQVQHLKVDQPAHDDMGKDDKLRDLQDHHQDLKQRGHAGGSGL
jgi:hypothetical protein